MTCGLQVQPGLLAVNRMYILKKLILLFLLGAALAGCGEDANRSSKIVVATDATLVPMSFINDRNQLDGFEIDLMRAVAQEAGLEIEMINVEWAGLLGGVLTHKFNAAISSITILAERQKKMAFSIPYLKSGLSIVVKKNTQGVSTLQDLQSKNLKVGAQRGTTAYFFLQKIPGLRPIGYDLYGHAVLDLIKGEVDAVVGESTGTLYYKNNDNAIFEKIKMVGEILTDEHYGIVMRQQDTQLIEAVNRALKTLLENGTVVKLHEQWDLGRAAVVPTLRQPDQP